MTQTCPKCSEKNSDESKFCNKCGSKLKMTKGNTIKKKNSRSGKSLLMAISVIIIIIAIAFVLILGGGSNTTNGGRGLIPQKHTITLYNQGAAFSLSPKSYQEVSWTVPSTATAVSIVGSYTSGGGVEVAVMTAQEYSQFSGALLKTDALASSFAYYGDTDGSTIDSQLAPGNTYYLVFYDPGIITTVTVNIGTPITLQYTN